MKRAVAATVVFLVSFPYCMWFKSGTRRNASPQAQPCVRTGAASPRPATHRSGQLRSSQISSIRAHLHHHDVAVTKPHLAHDPPAPILLSLAILGVVSRLVRRRSPFRLLARSTCASTERAHLLLALGTESHDCVAAERDGRDERAETAFAVIVVLSSRCQTVSFTAGRARWTTVARRTFILPPLMYATERISLNSANVFGPTRSWTTALRWSRASRAHSGA